MGTGTTLVLVINESVNDVMIFPVTDYSLVSKLFVTSPAGNKGASKDDWKTPPTKST